MFSVKLTVTSRQQISARVTGLSQVGPHHPRRLSPWNVHSRTVNAP